MTRTPPPHIVVAGGGVAAIEAVAALRALMGALPRIIVLAPDAELTPRPASVAAPFGFGLPNALPFDAIRRHARFDLHRGTLARVEADAHTVVDHLGESIRYDKLLIAVGAIARPALEGAISFGGPADVAAVERAVEDGARIAFVIPSASAWTLPAYELAIMAATELRGRSAESGVTIVTPEPAPLWVFGEQASGAIAELLIERGIAIRVGARATAVRPGVLELADGPDVVADRVIALPRLFGPAIPGLPHGAHGFIATDAHGHVGGVPDVFAAGDATSFPLKQGGLATQQADAAAETIAAELGAAVKPAPFRPVMRGLLLTGGAPLYLRSVLTLEGEPDAGSTGRFTRRSTSAVSHHALWWPPGKIAGRYLAPLLATARPPLLATSQLQDFQSVGGIDDGRDDARELALLLADEEAAMGDYAQAIHALDAATALTGGVLPAEWAQRREQWMAARLVNG
jgi:sulfide:quinone oxidoreductase